MSNTLSRMIAMLRHIPRHPRKIDTTSLLQRLEGAGYQISLRWFPIMRNRRDGHGRPMQTNSTSRFWIRRLRSPSTWWSAICKRCSRNRLWIT
jgi:hypothetical protein